MAGVQPPARSNRQLPAAAFLHHAHVLTTGETATARRRGGDARAQAAEQAQFRRPQRRVGLPLSGIGSHATPGRDARATTNAGPDWEASPVSQIAKLRLAACTLAASGRVDDRSLRRSRPRCWIHEEGEAGASWIRANADSPFGRGPSVRPQCCFLGGAGALARAPVPVSREAARIARRSGRRVCAA